ncbi:MAG: MBL fold metallo-hydrolase [Thermodesulfobacteriota bacterium]
MNTPDPRQPRERSFGPLRFLPGPNRGKYPHCHSVYIEGAKVLIDPASDRDRLARLRDEEGVEVVILSHWHEDHFAHLDLFNGAAIWIHEKDLPPLRDVEILLDWYGMDRRKDPELRDGWRKLILDNFNYAPRNPARLLSGNETLPLGSVTARVIHTPGHTPGNIALHFPDLDVLFAADYDLTAFGPWYGDPAGSMEDTVRSVEALKALNAGVVLTSHETGVFESPAPELYDAYLAVIETRERKLLEFLNAPRTLADIVNQWIVYRKPREPFLFYEWAERATMEKHLEKLTACGLVQHREGRFVRTRG